MIGTNKEHSVWKHTIWNSLLLSHLIRTIYWRDQQLTLVARGLVEFVANTALQVSHNMLSRKLRYCVCKALKSCFFSIKCLHACVASVWLLLTFRLKLFSDLLMNSLPGDNSHIVNFEFSWCVNTKFTTRQFYQYMYIYWSIIFNRFSFLFQNLVSSITLVGTWITFIKKWCFYCVKEQLKDKYSLNRSEG